MNANLIAYRKLLGLSQTELGKIAGIGLTTYSAKETGKKPFNQNEMLSIYNFFQNKGIDTSIEIIFFSNKVSILKTCKQIGNNL